MLLSLPTRPLTILFYYCSLLHDKYVIDSADKASNNIDLLLLLSFVTNMLLSLPTRPLNNIVLLLLKTNPQNFY
jgi:hypothetical protein